MRAFQDRVISTNNYRQCTLKEPNTTNYPRLHEKPRGTDAIQHAPGACRPPAQGAYTHRQNQTAGTFTKNYQTWAVRGSTNTIL